MGVAVVRYPHLASSVPAPPQPCPAPLTRVTIVFGAGSRVAAVALPKELQSVQKLLLRILDSMEVSTSFGSWIPRVGQLRVPVRLIADVPRLWGLFPEMWQAA